MPKWLIDVLVLVLGAGAVLLCGWLSNRLHLKNWHLAIFLAAGIVVFVLGGLTGLYPAIFVGIVLFAFPLGAWGYRGLMFLASRRTSK